MKRDGLDWYQGFKGAWLKECGSSNYLIPAFIFTLIGIGTSIFLIVNQNELATELLGFIVCFSIVCAYSAVAWQSIRMQATEWHHVVPQYKDHIITQAKILLVTINGLLAISLVFATAWQALSLLFITNVGGLAFWLLCSVRSQYFGYNVVLFFGLALVFILFDEGVPIGFTIAAIATLIGLFWLQSRLSINFRWNNRAISDYRQGLQSAWSPIPSNLFNGKGLFIQNLLLPLSYFVGSTLNQYVILLTMLCLIAVAASIAFGVGQPALFIFANVTFIFVFLCHWIRAQRYQSWEALFTLPLYDSQRQAKQEYAKANLKLAIYIGFLLMLLSVTSYMCSDNWNIYQMFSYVFANIGGVLLCSTLSNLLKTSGVLSIFISLSMGLSIGVTGYLLESQVAATSVIISICYAIGMSIGNHYTARYLYHTSK